MTNSLNTHYRHHRQHTTRPKISMIPLLCFYSTNTHTHTNQNHIELTNCQFKILNCTHASTYNRRHFYSYQYEYQSKSRRRSNFQASVRSANQMVTFDALMPANLLCSTSTHTHKHPHKYTHKHLRKRTNKQTKQMNNQKNNQNLEIPLE